MMSPRRRRRRKLLLLVARAADDAGIKLLSEIWPIYEKDGTIQTLTTAEESVCTNVDNFYLTIDPGDDPDFDMCAAEVEPETIADGLEAVANVMDAYRNQ